MDSTDLLTHFLPEGILDYFKIIEVKETKDRLTLVLEEKLLTAEEQLGMQLHSKGFYPPVQIQDFPVRRKACYLEVKRRRWLDINTNTHYSRDWNLIAQGTRMTSEFALFLKRLIGSYPSKL